MQAMLSALVYRAKAILDTDILQQGLGYVANTFLGNGYSIWQVLQAPSLCDGPTTVSRVSYLVAFSIFVSTPLHCIRRVLSKDMTKTVLLRFLEHIKDEMALEMPGVCSIPCESGEMHIGQTRN